MGNRVRVESSEWPRDWQMPGPRVAQNLQMPHPRDWQGGQKAPISPGWGGDWAQLELADPLSETLKTFKFIY